MACSDVKELIHGYLDGELDLSRSLEIEHHLKECQAPRPPSAAASASLLRRMAARPWAKAAVVVLGVLLGLVRIVLTLDLILRA